MPSTRNGSPDSFKRLNVDIRSAFFDCLCQHGGVDQFDDRRIVVTFQQIFRFRQFFSEGKVSAEPRSSISWRASEESRCQTAFSRCSNSASSIAAA
ncbi:hypothetical protein DMH88_15290 [Escherichia coli]|nr:hypothetical protein [Escherichia coli]